MGANPSCLVAIIEDDADFLKALERVLLAYGYRVLAFRTAEAYFAADWSAITCTVIDIQLGGRKSGIDLGLQLAATGHRPPIVYMTACTDPTLRARAFALGCAAYLEKPFSTERLVGVIEGLRSSALPAGRGAAT